MVKFWLLLNCQQGKVKQSQAHLLCSIAQLLESWQGLGDMVCEQEGLYSIPRIHVLKKARSAPVRRLLQPSLTIWVWSPRSTVAENRLQQVCSDFHTGASIAHTTERERFFFFLMRNSLSLREMHSLFIYLLLYLRFWRLSPRPQALGH